MSDLNPETNRFWRLFCHPVYRLFYFLRGYKGVIKMPGFARPHEYSFGEYEVFLSEQRRRSTLSRQGGGEIDTQVVSALVVRDEKGDPLADSAVTGANFQLQHTASQVEIPADLETEDIAKRIRLLHMLFGNLIISLSIAEYSKHASFILHVL